MQVCPYPCPGPRTSVSESGSGWEGDFQLMGNWDNGEKREIYDGEMESKREAESDEGG